MLSLTKGCFEQRDIALQLYWRPYIGGCDDIQPNSKLCAVALNKRLSKFSFLAK
jgi:hypothetical protein